MILRKSAHQISFLHIYHHSSITFVSLYLLTYTITGDIILPVMLNSSIHVIMYGYYLITGLGIKLPVIVKKSITVIQLIQFVLIAVQSILGYKYGCGLPTWLNYLLVGYMVTMIVLFSRFFINTYVLPKKVKKD